MRPQTATLAAEDPARDGDGDADRDGDTDGEASTATAPIDDDVDPAKIEAERQAFYQAEFDAEPIDQEWSKSQVRAIKAAFEGSGFSEFALQRAECRRTLCRLEVSLQSGDGARQVERMWLGGQFK